MERLEGILYHRNKIESIFLHLLYFVSCFCLLHFFSGFVLFHPTFCYILQCGKRIKFGKLAMKCKGEKWILLQVFISKLYLFYLLKNKKNRRVYRLCFRSD